MLKLFFLFFVISTFIMLAKSDFKIDWICEETNAMGNCSTVPKITDWLEVLAANIDTNEYTDFNYCPFEIVERHSRCMKSYAESCYQYETYRERHTFSVYTSPAVESAKNICTKGRAYKKEFNMYTSCTKSIFHNDYNDPWNVHQINQEVEFGLIPKQMDLFEKCDMYRKYWDTQNSWIRKKCGMKTSKFSRQVLSHMWPLMALMRRCGEELTIGGYM